MHLEHAKKTLSDYNGVMLQRYGALRTAVVEHFGKDDLNVLSFDLGVMSDKIANETAGLDIRTMEVIRYFDERGRLGEFVVACAKARPTVKVDWQSLLREIETRRTDAACPYPGMVAFTDKQGELFFGRDHQIQRIIERLRDQKLLFVVGPSGSGKSSLLQAGVAACLKTPPSLPSSSTESAEPWMVQTMTPGDRPLQALQTTLASLASVGAEATHAGWKLLVIDQFEQLFAQNSSEQVQNDFIDAVLQRKDELGWRVCVVMGTNFYDHLLRSHFGKHVDDHEEKVLPLQGNDLRQAIREPAAKFDVAIETELVERLVHDAADQPVATLIQETLRALWEGRKNDLISLSAYAHMGSDDELGLFVALEKQARRAMEQLSPTQKVIAYQILLALIAPGKPGISNDTRRRQMESALRTAYKNSKDFDATLQVLDHYRLVTRGKNEANEAVVDMSHEALLTHWQAFKDWLGKNRPKLDVQRKLQDDVDTWRHSETVHNQLDDTLLYRGSVLQAALDYAVEPLVPLTDEELRFLHASQQADEDTQRLLYRGQTINIAIGTGLGFGVFFAIYALIHPGDPKAWPADNIFYSILIFLLMAPVGFLVGGMIGLGLWWNKDHASRRGVLTTLFSGAMGVAVFLGFAILVKNYSHVLQISLVGALVGGGIAISICYTRTRMQCMLLSAVLCCLAGLAFANVTSAKVFVFDGLAGMLLGILAALGYLNSPVTTKPAGSWPAIPQRTIAQTIRAGAPSMVDERPI